MRWPGSIRPPLTSCWTDLSFYLLLSVVSVVEPFPLWEPQGDVPLTMCPSLSLSTESFPRECSSVSSMQDGRGTAEMHNLGQPAWLRLRRELSIIPGEALDVIVPSSLCMAPLTRLLPLLSGVWNMSLLIMTQINWILRCDLYIWTRN